MPLIHPPDRTLRFAVGRPEGLRSSTWTVLGHVRDGDVYIGSRSNMRETKLSLHRSGIWRLAYTEESGRSATLDGDRVLTRYEPPAEVVKGWRRGATIVIPHSSLRHAFPEKSPKRGAAISWWATPGVGRAMRFDILLRLDDDADQLTVNDMAGEVGRIRLGDGAGVWVVATEIASSEDDEREFYEHRQRATSIPGSQLNAMPYPTAMAWGFDNSDGAPMLCDPTAPVVNA